MSNSSERGHHKMIRRNSAVSLNAGEHGVHAGEQGVHAGEHGVHAGEQGCMQVSTGACR